MKVSKLDRWVSENNIPTTYEYGKGWWDYIEWIRRLADRVAALEVSVVGSYHVDTPPPCERLPMPAVAIDARGVTYALRFDFGTFALRAGGREWAVSVRRRTPYRGPWFGLISETEDLRQLGLDGIPPEYLFGPYREDRARFTVLVRDHWDVATLMRMVGHEA